MKSKKSIEQIEYEIYHELWELVRQEFKNEKFQSYYIFEGFFDGYRLFHSEEKDDDYYLLLRIFDYIFSLGEKGKIYLWNEVWDSIICREFDPPTIYREDFTKEQLAFIDEILSTNEQNKKVYGENYLYNRNIDITMNINKPTVLERIRLSRFESKLNLKYLEFFRNNPEEYEMYYLNDYDEYFLDRFCSQLHKNLSFAILDDFTNEFYGVISLSSVRNDSLYNIECFIFPEYRGNGYAKEAVKGLLTKAINKELYILLETIRKGIVEKEVANIKCIEAKIQTDNLPSQKLVESCGFKLNGLIPFAGKLKDNYYDEKMYHFIIK
ncbi:RimJ/RimL family protein N-acetyltransferase [Anaeroplasma bactoclasticum]|jgi:RimJ/RimL family protein N-acetyltransferase|uniref:RimJ/RimL family protein N-acetyltransferase n=1 Tax=Anaeroplasma bactoclasticum TaxID=2088 RepID=A0A397RUP6_9MOLU|nr:GNAT family N-acetyltransferase [Anaeroplasma bactoclasticum]RIA77913.1 RimJ/RimL family protein N-acetyltransferase [Anaeroplasma bactoclasticum]